MFRNEVIVSEQDKAELLDLLKKANEILDKYPYWNPAYPTDSPVTTISRAKGFVRDGLQWCSYLHTGPDET